MKPKNLATALATALTRNPSEPPALPGMATDVLLVAALRKSATKRDQIIQRRIGVYPDSSGAPS